MALDVGSRLGVFEVTGRLGEGGMGVVYRATDTTLHRDVALKVLPDAFVNDPERLARFQREAKVLASLNHPNIAAIYGLEEAGDSPALVLEYVPGPTLGARPSIRVGRARGSCEPQTRSAEKSMPRRIGDDVRRGLRPQPPRALRVAAAWGHLPRCASSPHRLVGAPRSWPHGARNAAYANTRTGS